MRKPVDMKKLIGFICIGCLCIAALIVVFCVENGKIGAQKSNNNNSLPVQAGDSGEKGTECEKINSVITKNNLSIEILSSEVIEDTEIESQTKYPAEWFASGELPDADYQTEYIDYRKVREACPELKAMWDNPNDYSIPEVVEIYEKNWDVTRQYITLGHPKTRYVFAKCKITNLRNGNNNASVGVYIFTSSENSKILGMSDTCLQYFDKAVNLVGEDRDHSFFWYPFKEGEVLECTLGFEIPEEYNENDKFYIGIPAPGEDYCTLENCRLIPLAAAGDTNE